jgi:hypothetical protein
MREFEPRLNFVTMVREESVEGMEPMRRFVLSAR